MTNTTNTDLCQKAAVTIADADFRHVWPIDVRKTLVRAAQTEGDLPTYAERIVRNAIRDAERIERKLSKDIERGEAGLSHADKQRLGKVPAKA